MKPANLLLMALALLVSGCQSLSSHHVLIQVPLADVHSSEQRQIEYQQVMEMMNAWAAESDMCASERSNLSSVTSDAEADVRECHFRDRLSKNGPMPLQAMLSCNFNELEIIQISFAEGYSKQPSERLKKVSTDLYNRLVIINEKTSYSIW